jgi:FkbM family methyltransferase
VPYARSYVARLITRLPPHRRTMLQPIIGGGAVEVTGAPPARGLLLRDLPLGHTQAWGLVRGLLEPSVQEAFKRHVGPGMVVWDVGANIGYFSLIAARLGATVHAFEPVPANAAAIKTNASANGYTAAVNVHIAAVAAQPGRASFLVLDDAGWSHLADRGQHAHTREEIEVEVIALDELALPAPDVIKIDVEGSEIAVLQGARRVLTKARPVVIIETHGTNQEVCDVLDNLGYLTENLDGTAAPRDAGPVHLLGRPG